MDWWWCPILVGPPAHAEQDLHQPHPVGSRFNQPRLRSLFLTRFKPDISLPIYYTSLIYHLSQGRGRKNSNTNKKKKKRVQETKKRLQAMAEQNQTEAGRHQEVGHKSLLQSDALYQVILQFQSPHIFHTIYLISSINNHVIFFAVYFGDQCDPQRT